MSNNISLNRLNLSQKFFLYLIPPLFGLFLFLNKEFVDSLFTSGAATPEVNILTSRSMPSASNKSDMEIVQAYEKLANLLNIKVLSVKFLNHKIFLKVSGDATIVYDFLAIIETTGQINTLDIKATDNETIADCVIAGNLFDKRIFSQINTNQNKPAIVLTNDNYKSSFKLKNIPRVNYQNESSNIISKTHEELNDDNYIEVLPRSKTIAIVGEYVLVSGEWLKVGDMFDGYKIMEITNKNLKLEKNGRSVLQEMFDD